MSDMQARKFQVRSDQTAQVDALFQRIDLLHGSQVDPSVGRSPENGVADEIRGVEGRRNGISGHPKPEFREIHDRLVHHRSGVRDPGGDIDVRHGLGQRGVLETAVADLGFQFEGRKRGPRISPRAQSSIDSPPPAVRFLNSRV